MSDSTPDADLHARIAQLESDLQATRAENVRLAQSTAAPKTAETAPITGPTVTCPSCGDVSAAPEGDEHFLTKTISRCSRCKVRIVYGAVGVRPVVEPSSFETPFGPRPAVLFRFQDGATKEDVYVAKLDPEAAFLLSQAGISLVRP